MSAQDNSNTETSNNAMLTFSLSHSPVQVQLLEDTHTIFDLIDIICQETCVGMSETVHDHMWDVTILKGATTATKGKKRKYNSLDRYVEHENECGYISDDVSLLKASKAKLGSLDLSLGAILKLEYDYGSTSTLQITLVDRSIGTDGSFPRRKPAEPPVEAAAAFETDRVDLDEVFPAFRAWMQTAEGKSLHLNLFQPGKKRNHGYFQLSDVAILHMIYLPTNPMGQGGENVDLSEYLHTVNYAAEFKHDGCHDWFSMVAFPHGTPPAKYKKYKENEDIGFCEARVAPALPSSSSSFPPLNAVFPKIAALAGYTSDKAVPKGWITYQEKTLRVCVGTPKSMPPSNAPPFTAFQGQDQHRTGGQDSILYELNEDIQSIHRLFCCVEGFLRTLE